MCRIVGYTVDASPAMDQPSCLPKIEKLYRTLVSSGLQSKAVIDSIVQEGLFHLCCYQWLARKQRPKAGEPEEADARSQWLWDGKVLVAPPEEAVPAGPATLGDYMIAWFGLVHIMMRSFRCIGRNQSLDILDSRNQWLSAEVTPEGFNSRSATFQAVRNEISRSGLSTGDLFRLQNVKLQRPLWYEIPPLNRPSDLAAGPDPPAAPLGVGEAPAPAQFPGLQMGEEEDDFEDEPLAALNNQFNWGHQFLGVVLGANQGHPPPPPPPQPNGNPAAEQALLALINKKEHGMLQVHFPGHRSTFDEWVPWSSERIMPYRTRTRRPTTLAWDATVSLVQADNDGETCFMPKVSGTKGHT